MIGEQLMELEFAGEAELLRESPPQYQFVHHESYVLTWNRTWTVATNRLSYDTALLYVMF
jgi:hypothetical protein